MKIEEINLTKHRLVHTCRLTNELVNELKLEIGKDMDDFMYDCFTGRLEATLVGMKQQTKILTYYTPRPSFLDWLLRRVKPIKIVVYVYDIHKAPVPERFVRLSEAYFSALKDLPPAT